MKEQPLDLGRLGFLSKRLAAAFFAEFPALNAQASMEEASEPDGLSLVIQLHSPTPDEQRTIQIWVDRDKSPSFGFGPDHAHGTPDDAGIAATIDLLRTTLDDRLLIAIDLGGKYDGHAAWLDTRDPLALVAELSSPHSPGSLLLKSFSGAGDRTVHANDLNIPSPPHKQPLAAMPPPGGPSRPPGPPLRDICRRERPGGPGRNQGALEPTAFHVLQKS